MTSARRRVLQRVRAHPDLICIGIILVAAGLLRATLMYRLPVMYVIASRPYYQDAMLIAHGLELTPLSLRRVPGYTFLLLGITLLFGVEPQAIALVQHVLGILSAVLCYLIGRLLGSRLIGLAAGLFMGLNTTLVVYEHQILSEPSFIFWFLLSIYLLLLAVRRGGRTLFVLAGVAIGASALTRLVGQASLLATPIAFWMYYRRLRPVVVGCCLVVLGFALVTGPWILRNRLVYSEASLAYLAHPGSPILSTMMHERPYTKGFFAPDEPRDPDPVRYEARKIVERLAPSEPDPLELWTILRQRLDLTPAEASRMMGEIALETISRHPWWYAQVYARKIGNLYALPRDESLDVYLSRTQGEWPGRYIAEEVKSGILPNVDPSAVTAAQRWELSRATGLTELFKPTRAAPLLAVFFTIGVVGALLRPDRRLVLVPALAFLVGIVATGLVVGDKPRYRYPLDPVVGIVALCGLAMLVEATAAVTRRTLDKFHARRQLPAPAN